MRFCRALQDCSLCLKTRQCHHPKTRRATIQTTSRPWLMCLIRMLWCGLSWTNSLHTRGQRCWNCRDWVLTSWNHYSAWMVWIASIYRTTSWSLFAYGMSGGWEVGAEQSEGTDVYQPQLQPALGKGHSWNSSFEERRLLESGLQPYCPSSRCCICGDERLKVPSP